MEFVIVIVGIVSRSVVVAGGQVSGSRTSVVVQLERSGVVVVVSADVVVVPPSAG